MGRLEGLLKFAFGRSALQPPDLLEEDSDNGQGPNDTGINSERDSVRYIQQYDQRGHPIHPGSTDLKDRLVHAQNDVLATIGLCRKVKDKESSQQRPELEPDKLELVFHENVEGQRLSNFNRPILVLSDPWMVGLRQRLQTFSSYLEQPLSMTMRSDWRESSPFWFLYSGAIATSVCYTILTSTTGVLEACEIRYPGFYTWVGKPIPLSARSKNYLKSVFSMGLDTILAVLVAPIEIFSVLQRLGFEAGWPLLPSPTFYRNVLSQMLGLSKSPALASGGRKTLLLFVVYAWLQVPVLAVIHRYVYTIMPRGTHPDSYSKKAGRAFIFDDLSVMHHSNAHAPRVIDDVLANDVQALGRFGQGLRDGLEGTLRSVRSWLFNHTEDSVGISNRVSSADGSTSPVGDLPDDLRQAMGTIVSGDNILPLPPSVLGRRNEMQDLLDPMPSEDFPLRPSAQRYISHPSSPLATQSVTPGAVDAVVVSSAGTSNETTHEQSSGPVQADEDNLPDINGTHVETSVPIESPISRNDQGFHAYSETSSSTPFERTRPYQRITLLSEFAADSMTLHLTNLLAGLVLLPLEARFVRTVALNFGRARVHGVAGQGGSNFPMPEIYSPGSWFGLGFRAGGWRGVSRYAGKMFLVWGIQVGIGFALWQVGMAYAWWRGRRVYKWGEGRPRS